MMWVILINPAIDKGQIEGGLLQGSRMVDFRRIMVESERKVNDDFSIDLQNSHSV
jgi:xanthine dehydrogenase molybdopterin-binding subunit B